MDAQRTPDELIAENKLICAKLLGWTPDDGGWIKSDGYMYGGCGTPTFTTWAEAGLILEALATTLVYFEHGFDDTDNEWFCEIRPLHTIWATSGPLAIRGAVVEYLKVMKP